MIGGVLSSVAGNAPGDGYTEALDYDNPLRRAITNGDVWSALMKLKGATGFGRTLGEEHIRSHPSTRLAYAPVRNPDTVVSPRRTSGCAEPEMRWAESDVFVLTLAAQQHHASMVSMLIGEGAPVDGFDAARGETALMTAAALCSFVETPAEPVIDAVLRLARAPSSEMNLDSEQDDMRTRVRRDTVLWAAARTRDNMERGVRDLGDLVRNAAILHRLIDAGASVDLRDAWGRTALFYAASAGNAVAVRLLLDAGANPNAVDDARARPLMAAADNASTPASDLPSALVVAELLRGGALPTRTDLNGRTAADYVGSRLSTARVLADEMPDDGTRTFHDYANWLGATRYRDGNDASLETLAESQTLALLRSDTPVAAALRFLQTGTSAPGALSGDEARRADLGDVWTQPMSPSEGPAPDPLPPAASQRLTVDCAGMEAGQYTIRAVYDRGRPAERGMLRSVAPLDWPAYPRGIEEAVERGRSVARSSLNGQTRARAACFLRVRDMLHSPADVSGPSDRWPTYEIPVEVYSVPVETLAPVEAPPPPPPPLPPLPPPPPPPPPPGR